MCYVYGAQVPIMFVCLLYLANDKELRIDGVDDMNNLLIQQKAGK